MGALHGVADFAQHILFPVSVCAATIARAAAAEPDAFLDSSGADECDTDDAGPRLQYRSQLHDKYQLAVVLAGHNARLSGPDGCARGSELRFCGGWNRGGCGHD